MSLSREYLSTFLYPIRPIVNKNCFVFIVVSLGISLTSTILEHCVPFPAPGPPSTNTTCGFIVSNTLLNKLGTL